MIYAILISVLIVVILFLLFARKDKYNGLLRVSKQIEELNAAIETKNKELENIKDEINKNQLNSFAEKRELEAELNRRKEDANRELAEHKMFCDEQRERLNYNIQSWQQSYDAIIAPLQLMQEEEDKKQYHCLTTSENAQDDITFLLNEVEPRMHNKAVIPKLIWTEYYQAPTQDLMKRIKMDDTPGIYKITNIHNGMCYIGQATKLKSRCIDHIKGAIGVTSISDQKIHTAMRECGLGNFMFEKICNCPKDELNEKEKFYIEFFRANEYGYNLTKGNKSNG